MIFRREQTNGMTLNDYKYHPADINDLTITKGLKDETAEEIAHKLFKKSVLG
jgi:hypothetical protein